MWSKTILLSAVIEASPTPCDKLKSTGNPGPSAVLFRSVFTPCDLVHFSNTY